MIPRLHRFRRILGYGTLPNRWWYVPPTEILMEVNANGIRE